HHVRPAGSRKQKYHPRAQLPGHVVMMKREVGLKTGSSLGFLSLRRQWEIVDAPAYWVTVYLMQGCGTGLSWIVFNEWIDHIRHGG
ncbi:hypothetical protein QTP70_033996, partial [Hemibagrus guttatus]